MGNEVFSLKVWMGDLIVYHSKFGQKAILSPLNELCVMGGEFLYTTFHNTRKTL